MTILDNTSYNRHIPNADAAPYSFKRKQWGKDSLCLIFYLGNIEQNATTYNGYQQQQ